MRRYLSIIAAAPILLGGCFSGEQVPFLGRWTGSFDVTSASQKMPIKKLARYSMKGFVELYRSQIRVLHSKDERPKSKFVMHLDGEQESIDVTGQWELRNRQLMLTATDVKIDDAGGEALRDPNRTFIAADDLRASLQNPFALDFTAEKNDLKSPLLQVGPLFGRYQFTKDSLAQ